MDVLSNPETWIALLTLTTLEIVLGIDNVIFISVLVQRLPVDQRDRARVIGLGLAAGMRILLLLTISWIIGLTATVMTIGSYELSWRDIILIVGGLFLLWKATHRDHNRSKATRHMRPSRRIGVVRRHARPDRRCSTSCSRSIRS